jgi:hypothetical protein
MRILDFDLEYERKKLYVLSSLPPRRLAPVVIKMVVVLRTTIAPSVSLFLSSLPCHPVCEAPATLDTRVCVCVCVCHSP